MPMTASERWKDMIRAEHAQSDRMRGAAFSVGAAQSLVEQGVELVGLDYLSVAHADEQVPVHRAF